MLEARAPIMVTFLLLNGGAVLAALLIALATHGRARAAEVLFAAGCAYLLLIHSIVLFTGLAGHLTAGGVAVAVAGALVLAAWLARRASVFTPADERVAAPNGPPIGAASIFPVLAAAVAA